MTESAAIYNSCYLLDDGYKNKKGNKKCVIRQNLN